MNRITRVEIITDTGRDYVNWEDDNDITVSYQDDGRTLKVFVNKTGEEGALEALEEWLGTEPPEELKTLYQMFENEGAYGQIYFDDALKVVKEWMSQYADNVMCGEYKKGYEYCLTVLKENLKND